MGKTGLSELNTAWNVSAFAVFLVHIFPHLDWIFSANAGIYGPQKLRIRTLFAECKIPKPVHSISAIQNGRFIFASGNHYRREIICTSWIWKVVIFQFHCNIHHPRILTKLLKMPMSVLRRINIWIVIYLWYVYNGSSDRRNSDA